MTTWNEAHRRASVLAAEVHGDLQTPLDRPVDVFGAVRRAGLVLAFAPLGRVSGLYLPEQPTSGVLLHSGHPRTRQRYTAGHELGHHYFGHASEVDGDLEELNREVATRPWPDHEKEAEAFGAWFLMPRRLLREGLAQLRIPSVRSEYDVYALSLWLGTSYTATARQLATTGVVRRDQADEWARIPPRTIKRSLAGEFAPDDLRNDVWWRDEKHTADGLEVRAGDRIVVTLAETPSSGYAWRFEELPADVAVLADSNKDEWEPPAFARSGVVADDIAGRSTMRSFVLEVNSDAEPSVQHLALVKDQAWDHSQRSGAVEVTLSVQARLYGLQIPEAALAISA